MSVLPQHKTDAIFRVENKDRYDDRDILDNQGLIGKRDFLQLSMQITSNTREMQDLRRDLRTCIHKIIEPLKDD